MNVSASSPTALFCSKNRLILLVSFLCLLCGNALAQAPSSDYTVDLPSVERVKAEIKGSNLTDTLARQCAVFTYLYTYVDRIKLNRSYSGPYTPGETRVMTAYRLAAYQISQDYAKSHTPDEAKAFERLHGQYEMNSAFYDDWTKRLIGKQSAAAYKGAEAGLAAGQRAHVAQEQQQYQKDVAAQQAGASGMSSDPTAVATRRCLELGGDSTACVGKSFVGGLLSMVGMGSGTMQAITGPGRAGVVLSGIYHTPGAATSINFGTGTATIGHCGTLEGVDAAYTLRKSSSILEITLQTEPHPIQLAMRPDGSLIGPGLIDVKGQIIVGYHTVTATQMINGSRAAPNQCNGPCQTISRVPDYAPRTEHCSIASFAPPPPAPPASADKSQDAGIFGAITGMMGTISPVSEPGLRMAGKYSSSTGLLLDFGADAVTLDCGQAHVKQPYIVENTPTQLLIRVQNNGGPFTLAVTPDNTLHGSGSTTVNGRLVSGMNGDNVTFSPRSEHCTVGAFTSGAAASSTSIAGEALSSYAPSPASPTPVERAAVVPAIAAESTAPAVSASRVAMRVNIVSQFAGANPAAGQSIYVMHKRIGEVLSDLGVSIPANATAGQAMQTLASTCRTRDCSSVMSGLTAAAVTAVKLDATGKAILSANARGGAYFFFLFVRVANGSTYIWDIPADLHAGDNTITLTAANAELIH